MSFPGGRRRKFLSGDEAVALKGAEPFGEQVATYAGETLDQIGEPAGPRHELAHDQQGPPIASNVEGACQTAELLVAMFRHSFFFALSGTNSIP